MASVEELNKIITRNSAGRLVLNLSKRGLTRVPDAVSLMTEVEVLDLSDNPITDIPASLSKLTNLEALHLNGCRLKNVSFLSQLTSLQTLDISGNGNIHNLHVSIVQLRHLKKINLSHCGLTEITAGITQLTSLEELDLSSNPIKRLPEGFASLKRLRKLNLLGCGLTEIGTGITQLTSLEELYLSKNPIKGLPEGFSNLQQLKKLNLWNCGLTEIGTCITQLTSLEELYLSKNPIKRLPEVFSNLQQLKKLYLSECGLKEIGTDITQLASLEELHLSKNPINGLPNGFSNLKRLKKLHLWHCGLTEIGTDITQMTSLEELHLSENPIQKLPKCFSNLKHIKKLSLTNCRLTEIGTGITQLISLEELYLSKNLIQRLSKGFSNLKQLKKLTLTNCGLTEIGTGITQLISLEELYLSKNPIQKLPQGFGNLKHLRILNTWDCGLKGLGSEITQLTSLEEFYLSKNPIKRLPEGFLNLKKLTKLTLWNCELTEIGTGITQLASLEELDLSSNPIKKLPEGFSNLKQLKKVTLVGCGLTEIGTGITQLASLEELDLSSNPIKKLPEGFSNLKQLKKVTLVGCGLTEIGTGITQLASLEELHLSNNPIKRLPKGLSNLQHVKKLHLKFCRLTEIADEICEIPNLEELNLNANQLKEVTLNVTNLIVLRKLNLQGNPLQFPPPEVCEQGVEAIFRYLSEIRLGKALHQKVVLLGSSGAGKTSLAKTMVKNKPSCVEEDDRTIVLDRIMWELRRNDKNLSVSLIDFGGNDWYKIVHHLFIEENALYLLLVNLAKYSKRNFYRDVGSWLNVLLTRVPKATFKLVGTHADQCTQEDTLSKCESIESDVRCTCEREGLHWEGSTAVKVISSQTMAGISGFRDDLLSLVCEKGKVIPPAWLELYKKLQSPHTNGKPYFVLEEVKSIDREVRRRTTRKRKWEEGGSKEEAANIKTRIQAILRFFHIIGAILWYEHTPALSQFVFHNPEYLTNLLKAVFSERLETQALSYDKSITFKTTFYPDKFQQVKERLLRQGVMPIKLLRCLWEHNNLDEEVFNAMVHLFQHLGFCYPLSKDDEGQVTSLRFPWFLTDTVPEDPKVQQILFGPPDVECHRFTLEYRFLTICPPPLYEKFAVRMHPLVRDAHSRIDWKDGVYAVINQSRVVVHRINRPTETVISLTVEGEDIVDLWEVLTSLGDEMKSVMKEWPGMRWESWLVCPYCLQYGIRSPCKFPGEQLEKECPKKCPYMTCERDTKVMVPSCLVYPVKGKLTTFSFSSVYGIGYWKIKKCIFLNRFNE